MAATARARRFTPTACAIRGATVWTARPAICGWATSARICGRKWTCRQGRQLRLERPRRRASFQTRPAGAQYIDPVMEYPHRPNLLPESLFPDHSIGLCVIGGYVYRGAEISLARRHLHLWRLQSGHDLGFRYDCDAHKVTDQGTCAAATEKHHQFCRGQRRRNLRADAGRQHLPGHREIKGRQCWVHPRRCQRTHYFRRTGISGGPAWDGFQIQEGEEDDGFELAVEGRGAADICAEAQITRRSFGMLTGSAVSSLMEQS